MVCSGAVPKSACSAPGITTAFEGTPSLRRARSLASMRLGDDAHERRIVRAACRLAGMPDSSPLVRLGAMVGAMCGALLTESCSDGSVALFDGQTLAGWQVARAE